jgi:DNA-binding MarR family transcriptional regulator
MDRSSIPQFCKALHQPIRLGIIAHLVRCGGEAPFLEIWSALGISAGLISAHNRVLEDASLIELRKRFVGRKTRTTLVLTETGRQALSNHQAALAAITDSPAMEATA